MLCVGSVIWAREGGEGILGNKKHSTLFRGCDYRDCKMTEWQFMYCVELGNLSMVNMFRINVFLGGSVVLHQQRKRLWVRFPGNTQTNENV